MRSSDVHVCCYEALHWPLTWAFVVGECEFLRTSAYSVTSRFHLSAPVALYVNRCM